MKLSAMEVAERDMIVFGEEKDWRKSFGDIISFKGLDLFTLVKLVDKGYLEVNEVQNDSPTVGEFIEFMKEHPGASLRAHGYVVSPVREDCRITIEGLETKTDETFSMELRHGFVKFCRHADELIDEPQYLRSWWE